MSQSFDRHVSFVSDRAAEKCLQFYKRVTHFYADPIKKENPKTKLNEYNMILEYVRNNY